jgi:O-antigen/teichoic acid export membrane protein
MACSARELLAVVYEPQYVAMAVPFMVLCVQLLARNEAVVFAGIYLALGLPHQQRRFSAIRALSIIVFIYPAAVRFGTIGAVVVVALSNFLVLLLQALQGRKVIDLDLGRYMRSYAAGIGLAVPIIAAVGLFRLVGVESPVWILSVGAVLFVAASATGVLLFGRKKR